MDIFLLASLKLIIKSSETKTILGVCDFLLSFALFDSKKLECVCGFMCLERIVKYITSKTLM